MNVTFALFQSSVLLPDLHYFSEILDSGFATMSANSLNILGWISLGPIDLSGLSSR